MIWVYDGNIVEEIDPKYCGFVYLITNNLNEKQYIGKKLLQFKKTKQVNGKKKRFFVDSDWRSYYGSNQELNADVKVHGEDNFKREILKLCINKGELSYYEAKYQFEYDVLYYPEKFYNAWIMVKIRRSHILTKALLSEKTDIK